MNCACDHLGLKESARIWRADDIGDVELLHARYVTHSFARHTHEGAAIGVIEAGAERFIYRGATHVATAGQVIIFNPAEVHTGEGADKNGWQFRMFYLDAALLAKAASETVGSSRDVPFFPTAVLEDASLAKMIRLLHQSLEASGTSLERQSKFVWTFAQLAQRYADDRPTELLIGSEHSAVKLIRDYLEDHYCENVSLDEIAALTNLSTYHLIRVFRAKVGLPPHAYLEQVRINRAKVLLRAGMTISNVALSTGFVDQSHFSKHFKKMMGVTPGNYQAISAR